LPREKDDGTHSERGMQVLVRVCPARLPVAAEDPGQVVFLQQDVRLGHLPVGGAQEVFGLEGALEVAHGPADGVDHLPVAVGLEEVAHPIVLDGGVHVIELRVPGQEHDPAAGPSGTDLPEEVEPAQPGHVDVRQTMSTFVPERISRAPRRPKWALVQSNSGPGDPGTLGARPSAMMDSSFHRREG
jgi:hypothetical protein